MLSLFCQASELLNHPHLHPYILKIHLKLNSPRRSTFPFQWHESNYVGRTRFVGPDSVSTISDRYKRLSFSNDRALNPSTSGTEKDSLCSTQNGHDLSTYSREKLYELSSIGRILEECKAKATKFSNVNSNTPRLRTFKDSATPRRQTTPSKIFHAGSKRDSVSLCAMQFSAAPFHDEML